MKNTSWLQLLFGALFVFSLTVFAIPQTLLAQSNGGEQISWDDDDDEEEEEEETTQKFEEAVIYLNNEETPITDYVEVNRNETLDIKVRHLYPMSWVTVQMMKAGVNVKKQRFQANQKGELDLEVQTGKKKLKGSAVLHYTPSAGQNKTLEVQLKVI